MLKSKFPQRKAMQVTRDNLDSNEEDDDEREVANVACLVANDSCEVISLKLSILIDIISLPTMSLVMRS